MTLKINIQRPLPCYIGGFGIIADYISGFVLHFPLRIEYFYRIRERPSLWQHFLGISYDYYRYLVGSNMKIRNPFDVAGGYSFDLFSVSLQLILMQAVQCLVYDEIGQSFLSFGTERKYAGQKILRVREFFLRNIFISNSVQLGEELF